MVGTNFSGICFLLCWNFIFDDCRHSFFVPELDFRHVPSFTFFSCSKSRSRNSMVDFKDKEHTFEDYTVSTSGTNPGRVTRDQNNFWSYSSEFLNFKCFQVEEKGVEYTSPENKRKIRWKPSFFLDYHGIFINF